METAILIAAAGSSQRLGSPKQLLSFKNRNLLQVMIDECLGFKDAHVVVALGANGEAIEKQLQLKQCTVMHNPNWKNGMGNTIAFGVSQIQNDFKQIILVLGDQVHFSKRVLTDLMDKRKTCNADIIVSRYLNGQGPPVLFDRQLRKELEKLDGDDGAKSIIKSGKYTVDFIDFELGYLDVDRHEDLHLLNL